jgi:flagellar assembly protein FliH
MASKLIGADMAAGAQRLVLRDLHGDGGSQPGHPANYPAGSSAQADSELAHAIVTQQTRIQQLERELEQRPKQAYQKGFAEGQTTGAQQSAAKIEPALARLAESLRELASLRRKYLLEAEADAVKLAVAVARKILHRELSVDPESLLGVVKAAFERVDARDIHRIRLNPEDQPIVQAHLAAAGVPPQIELIADASLERGGVVIETSRGCLDASVASQLKEIERGLVDMVRRNPS